jgi:hypothetical protein
MSTQHTPGPLTIPYDGDFWRIIGQGAMRDGKIYCHLASTTKGVQQKNGWNPMQLCDWIDSDLVLSCAIQREEIMRKALSEISLCSQNSASSKEECGAIARAAIAKATGEQA